MMVEQMHDRLIEIHAEAVAVLFIEQGVGLALDCADRAYVLQSGRIEFERPADQLAADDRIRKGIRASETLLRTAIASNESGVFS